MYEFKFNYIILGDGYWSAWCEDLQGKKPERGSMRLHHRDALSQEAIEAAKAQAFPASQGRSEPTHLPPPPGDQLLSYREVLDKSFMGFDANYHDPLCAEAYVQSKQSNGYYVSSVPYYAACSKPGKDEPRYVPRGYNQWITWREKQEVIGAIKDGSMRCYDARVIGYQLSEGRRQKDFEMAAEPDSVEKFLESLKVCGNACIPRGEFMVRALLDHGKFMDCLQLYSCVREIDDFQEYYLAQSLPLLGIAGVEYSDDAELGGKIIFTVQGETHSFGCDEEDINEIMQIRGLQVLSTLSGSLAAYWFDRAVHIPVDENKERKAERKKCYQRVLVLAEGSANKDIQNCYEKALLALMDPDVKIGSLEKASFSNKSLNDTASYPDRIAEQSQEIKELNEKLTAENERLKKVEEENEQLQKQLAAMTAKLRSPAKFFNDKATQTDEESQSVHRRFVQPVRMSNR